jgi:hypothetical protein
VFKNIQNEKFPVIQVHVVTAKPDSLLNFYLI